MYLITFSITVFVLSASFNKAVSGTTHSMEDAAVYPQLWERQEDNDVNVCPLNSEQGVTPLGAMYSHFGYIGSSSYKTRANHYYYPLICGDECVVDTGSVGLTILQSFPLTCSGGTSDIYSYGLLAYADTLSNTGPVTVYGNILLNNTSSPNIHPAGDDCQIYPSSDSIVDLASLKSGLVFASKYLAMLKPDLTIDADGKVEKVGEQQHQGYHVFTINNCNPPATEDTSCSSWPLSLLSDAAIVNNDSGMWKGPKNLNEYNAAPTILINIPILHGTEKVIYSDVTRNFPACSTIVNFYPVNADGDYTDDFGSTFTIIWELSEKNPGFILAPFGDITVTQYPIQGKVFADRVSDSIGFEFFSTSCGGSYTGCFPVADYTSTSTSSSSSTESSSCTPSTVTTTDTTIETTTQASTTSTDYTTTTTTSYRTIAKSTVTAIETATSTSIITTTNTITTTYTSDHSTITAFVTTTAPVFIPVQNDWNDGREEEWRRHGWEDDSEEERRHHDWGHY